MMDSLNRVIKINLIKKFDESVKNFVWRVNHKVVIMINVNERQKSIVVYYELDKNMEG